jgi:hypothetical protein
MGAPPSDLVDGSERVTDSMGVLESSVFERQMREKAVAAGRQRGPSGI